MSCQNAVYQWTTEVATHLPHLSQPQVAVLALWSLGMVLARSCALTAVAHLLAVGLERKANSVRQQLREFCYEAQAKRGAQRQALAVASCFAPLLGWVLSWWAGQQLALAIEATALGARFVVLTVSVVYRGCAIPVAWTVLVGNTNHAWRGEWLRMLRQLRPAVPATWTVLVLADRGLSARGLYRRIKRLGWQPFLRINTGGTFRPQASNRFQPLRSFAPHPGTRWQGRGTAFVSRPSRLHCTLLACWEEGDKEAGFILTDLPPESSEACWYGLRAWIEQGFKITKRGGWQWQRTRMTDPERAARWWLAVALATLWLLSGGGEADASVPPSTLPDVTAVLGQTRRHRRATRLRLVSIFRQGWNLILGALLNQRRLPTGRFVPEPWPSVAEEETKLKVLHEVPLAA
jgi:Transposase DDE domain